MSRKICSKPFGKDVSQRHFRRKERGDALIDAMMAMVLVSIVGIGPVYVSAKATVVQRQSAMQQTASIQLRQLLLVAEVDPLNPPLDLCHPDRHPTITVAGTSLAVTVTCTDRVNNSIVIDGVAVPTNGTAAEKEIRLSVTSATLFGGSGTVAVDQGSVHTGG